MKSAIATVPRRNRQLLWFVLVLGFLEGAVINFLPVTFPIFKNVFGATLEEMGRTQALFFSSSLIFSAIGGWCIGRLGVRLVATTSVLILALALSAIGGVPSFQAVLAGAFCLGLAVTSIVVVCFTIINDFFPAQRQSIFFLFAIGEGAGATIGPAALGRWLNLAEAGQASWQTGYFIAAGFSLVLALWSLRLRRTSLLRAAGGGANVETSLGIMRNVLSKPAIYIIGLAMFLHTVAQVGMVSWIGQLHQKKLGIGAGMAADFISLNSAGFFVGRLAFGWLTARRKIPELLVLTVCAAMGTLGFVGAIAASNYAAGLLCFALAGVFISADAPSINSYTGRRFVSESATAFSLMNGIGNLGGAAGPYLVGVISDNLGLTTGIWLLPLFSAALALLGLCWYIKGGIAVVPNVR